MGPFRDDPEGLKLVERLNQIDDKLYMLNNSVENIQKDLDTVTQKGVVRRVWDTFKTWIDNSAIVAILWYPVRWGIFILGFLYLVFIGGRAGCTYEEQTREAQRIIEEREFCTRVCEGTNSTFVGRNPAIYLNNEQTELSRACLCSRDGAVFAINSQSGREIHDVVSHPAN